MGKNANDQAIPEEKEILGSFPPSYLAWGNSVGVVAASLLGWSADLASRIRHLPPRAVV
jgi:hypothetical protein